MSGVEKSENCAILYHPIIGMSHSHLTRLRYLNQILEFQAELGGNWLTYFKVMKKEIQNCKAWLAFEMREIKETLSKVLKHEIAIKKEKIKI